MSVLTRNSQPTEVSGIRGYYTQAAGQVAPIARNAVPMAQQAVPLAKQGADTVIARATPLVYAARSWAAPQLEQSAHAISETIAPMIADALMSTARKIDVPPQKPRRGPRILAASGLVALLASAATAVLALRRRDGSSGYSSVSAVDDGGPTLRPESATSGHTASSSASMGGDGSKPDSEADGTPRS